MWVLKYNTTIVNWREKDKKVRDVLVKRLFILREKSDELLRKIEQRCKLKEAKEVLSLIKTIDTCLDLIKFTNYGYLDFAIKHYEKIEEKQSQMFETLEEIEKTLDIDEKKPDVISHVRAAKVMLDSLKNTYNEIKSIIMAFIPPKREVDYDL